MQYPRCRASYPTRVQSSKPEALDHYPNYSFRTLNPKPQGPKLGLNPKPLNWALNPKPLNWALNPKP